MTYYIQKLHDDNREEDLVNFMQENFPNFEISYHNETEHTGYFEFRYKGQTVSEFVITSFFCHAFNIDDYLYKNGFEKQVNLVYREFMSTLYKDYLEEFKNTEITKQNEHLLA